MQPAPSLLTPRARQTLQAVCQALFPAVAPEAGDDPRLFQLDANTIGVPAEVERAIAFLDPDSQKQFAKLLATLESPLLSLFLVCKLRGFSRLAPADRERLLQKMALSRLGMFRAGFQVLKRLAAFTFYSFTGDQGENPTWPALGYTASGNPPAREPLLNVTILDKPTTLDCDVCVIGSGAGGGVMAGELAGAGKQVIVLEAGPGQQSADFDQHELTGMHRLFLDRGTTASSDLGVAILAGATLGGGTAVNWQTSLPLPAKIRDEWASLSGCTHFTDASFTRSLEAVSARLQVSDAESVVNRNNDMLRTGCAALGYRWQTLQRNAHGCDPAQCSYCMFGCRHGGKQSTAVTYLADAQRSGNTQIVAQCRADRVTMANGKVTGVSATASDAAGNRHAVQVRAPVVVVAAGALHSPAILLRSGLRLPMIGRNLFLHPTTAVAAQYDEPIELWKGPPQTILCDQFAELAGNYGFRLETAPSHPGLMALASPWTNARQHRKLMQQAAFAGSIIVLVRDREGGRVRLTRDGRPLIDYGPGRQELAHLRLGIDTVVRIHLAAGAKEVTTLHASGPVLHRTPTQTPAEVDAFCRQLDRLALDRNWSGLFSAHQMGTCRMGKDASSAVCDANGQVFGVRGLFIGDGSAFPASSGVNPMITIMALAHHTAQRMKEMR